MNAIHGINNNYHHNLKGLNVSFCNIFLKTHYIRCAFLFTKKFSAMQLWKNYQEENKERFLNELLDLLRMPSVSARSEHKPDMQSCAEAAKKSLLDAGVDKAQICSTKGHPVVYA